MDLIATEALEQDLATASIEAVAAVGPLVGLLVHLVQQPIAIDRNSLLADLVAGEANYSGYAAEAVTWQAVSRGDGGVIEIVGLVGEFRPTDGLAPNTIHAVYVTNAAGSKLYFVASISGTPLPMVSILDALILTLRYRPRGEGVAVIVS